jgi:hypothetical protein
MRWTLAVAWTLTAVLAVCAAIAAAIAAAGLETNADFVAVLLVPLLLSSFAAGLH